MLNFNPHKFKVMRKILILLFFVPTFVMAQQKTYMPDDAFEMHIETRDTTGGWCLLGSPASIGDGIMNDSVYTDYLDLMGVVDISNMGVSDLRGIEDMDSLVYLYCDYNNLSEIPLSPYQRLNIELVHCAYNKIDSLDFSGNTKLWELICNDNDLVYLNLDSCDYLTTELNCDNNDLTYLDISAVTQLWFFTCENNLLTDLIVAGAHIEEFHCSNNQLTTLDVTGVTYLYYLDCSYNNLTTLIKDQLIEELFCNNNFLSGPIDFVGSGWLDASYNQFTELDFSFPSPGAWNGYHYIDVRYNNLHTLSFSNIIDTMLANNFNIPGYYFSSVGNPDLHCITLDNPPYFDTVWTVANGSIDSCVSFSTACSMETEGCMDSTDTNYNPFATIEDCSCSNLVSNAEQIINSNRYLISIVDILGRERKPTPNVPLFYRYDDGTVEKRIVIE